MPRLTSFSQSGFNGIGSSGQPLFDLQSASVYTDANVYSRDSSTSWSSMDYNFNGTGLVITQDVSDSDARIYQYSLSVPYDLTAAGQSISYAGEQALGSSAFDNANNFSAHQYTGFNWSRNVNSGTAGGYWSILARTTDELLIRSSTSPYNLTGSAVDRGNLTLSTVAGSVDDVFFNEDNTKMYIAIQSVSAPNGHLRIREYTISSFDTATSVSASSPDAEYTAWLSTTGSRVGFTRCCRWSNSGRYLCVLTNSDMHLFYTSTPYDMAGMSKNALTSVDQALIGFNARFFAWWGDDSGMSGLDNAGRAYSLVF